MSVAFRVDDLAEADFEASYGWYQNQSSGLGDRFADELDEAFHRIRSAPDSYEVVAPGVRRLSLKRFPHSVVYRYDESGIFVLAVYHSRRHPRRWRDRL